MSETKSNKTESEKRTLKPVRLKRWLCKPSWNRVGKIGYWMGIIPFALLTEVNSILGIVGMSIQLLGCFLLILRLDKKKKRTKLVKQEGYALAQIKQIKNGKYETVGYLWLN